MATKRKTPAPAAKQPRPRRSAAAPSTSDDAAPDAVPRAKRQSPAGAPRHQNRATIDARPGAQVDAPRDVTHTRAQFDGGRRTVQ